MALATSTVAAIGLGVSALGSGYQMYQGARTKSAADEAASKAAQQYASIQEGNKFNELQVPTLGLELAQQNMQARQASNIQALQEGGAATVLGGLTAANQQAQAEDLQLSAQAQEAQYARDMARAQNAQQLEANRVNREAGLAQSRLQGAQAAAAQGESTMAAGIAGLAEAGVSAATLASYKDIYGKPAETVTQQNLNPKSAFAPAINAMAPKNIQQVRLPTSSLAQMPAPVGIMAQPPVQNWTQQASPYPWASLGFNK